MKAPVMITVYTQVYNTKPYIRRCVESVLKQTYPHFEYYISDNGSTDGCKEILEEYAASDKRIKLFRNETNSFLTANETNLYVATLGERMVRQECIGAYYTVLDSDDWWEPDYLEHLLAFAERHNLDIACTGSEVLHMATGNLILRKAERELFFSRETMAAGLQWYHFFFRTTWGKLVRTDCMKNVSLEIFPRLSYGIDTVWAFQCLRHAGRIGIDTSALYHYRVHGKSISYQYDSNRFKSDVFLYNDAIDFLSAFGPISAQNRLFLQIVYSNAVNDTAGVIHDSSLSPEDKLREYRTIASHPLTLSAYRECELDAAERSRSGLIHKSLQAGADLKTQDDENLRHAMQNLSPHCGRAVSCANSRMFLEDPQLMQALLRDDAEALLQGLLTRMEENRDVKKYAIPETIQALAVDNLLLCQISDAAFLRKYSGIYLRVWKGEALTALDEMTGLLLENKAGPGQETFLQLYISLSAALEQVPAFIFGKLQLAQLYFQQNRASECRAIVSEMEEMGLTDNEELAALKHCLNTD